MISLVDGLEHGLDDLNVSRTGGYRGNAPTALLEVIRLVREEEIRPALIVGVPVGFVNAAESKEELLTLDVPYITTVGRKGGSSVAVATINALLRLAVNNK